MAIPALHLRAANQPDSYCHSHLKSIRSQPLLLSVQRADSITLVTLILVKREDAGVLTTPPELFLSSPFSISGSTSPAVFLHTLFPSLLNPFPCHLSNLRLHFSHMLPPPLRFTFNNCPGKTLWYVFPSFLSISPTSLPEQTITLRSCAPPPCPLSSAKHCSSHTQE